MNKYFKLAIFSLIFLNCPELKAEGLSISGLEDGIRQGDVCLIRVKSQLPLERLNGNFAGSSFFFEKHEDSYTALVGADMLSPLGEQVFTISGDLKGNQYKETVTCNVLPRDYKVERLSLPDKMVTPDSNVIDRIIREAQALNNVRMMVSPKRLWEGAFLSPSEGTMADNFGARRILNGIEKKPHSGLDIKAFKGTPVKSPNDGKVVYVDRAYYGGKTVAIDHGHGLSTVYMHLSKILVTHGESIKKGQVIGLVGSTGRSTGPHLHWGAYLGGAKIDPASLLSMSFDGLSLTEGTTVKLEEINIPVAGGE